MALAYTVRDRILARWLTTKEDYIKYDVRTVYYFSAEFLMGPHLANNILNLGLKDQIREATDELDLDLDLLIQQESEPGLGNGGLGRLAACYLDSLATLSIPAMGYGIRYEFGMFHQEIHDGWQVELTDYWLRYGNPWEIRRPQAGVEVGYGGHTQSWTDQFGIYKVQWIPDTVVKGIPYDTPILGYRSGIANTLRLWRSEATESFYFGQFNSGDYTGPSAPKSSPKISPRSSIPTTKRSRAKSFVSQQQYFFTSCSLQDMIRRHLFYGHSIEIFHRKLRHPAQRHPSLHRRRRTDAPAASTSTASSWDKAWEITSHTFNYTNHTLLPEALERWPLPMFAFAASPPPRDHLRDQRTLPRPRARPLSQR